MSRYEGLKEKADYVGSMLTPRIPERKCFKRFDQGENYCNLVVVSFEEV
jgi:hypothetical protein